MSVLGTVATTDITPHMNSAPATVHCSPRRADVSSELTDDFCDTSGKVAQDFQDGPLLGKESFIERYLKGDINLVIRPNRDAAQWGAVFQISKMQELRSGRAALAYQTEQTQFSGTVGHAQEPLMFSENIKSVKSEELCIPSVVRLELLDSEAIGWGQPRYFLAAEPFGAMKSARLLAMGK